MESEVFFGSKMTIAMIFQKQQTHLTESFVLKMKRLQALKVVGFFCTHSSCNHRRLGNFEDGGHTDNEVGYCPTEADQKILQPNKQTNKQTKWIYSPCLF